MSSVYDETEEWYRQHPSEGFLFMPVGYDSHKQGRLTCFRRVTELHKEAEHSGVAAWAAVIWRDRKCDKWSRYEPGFAPREQFAEERSRKFARQLNRIAVLLGLGGIAVALLVGALVMPSDAIGCQTVKNLIGWTVALSWLHCH